MHGSFLASRRSAAQTHRQGTAAASSGIVSRLSATAGEPPHHALKARMAAQRLEVAVVLEPVAAAAAEFASALEQVYRPFGFAGQAVIARRVPF